MSKKQTASKSSESITRAQFTQASNMIFAMVRQHGKSRSVTDFKKKVDKIFPAKDPQSKVSADKVLRALFNAVSPKIKGSKTASLDAAEQFNFFLARFIIQSVPPLLKTAIADQQKEAAQRQKAFEKSLSRERTRETKSERIDRLERENASLRGQVQSAPRSAEEILAEHRYWEANDTRIGGGSYPQPMRGLRD